MDNRPIGFFDSGLGGLTCIPYLMKHLPDERVVYFGDTARTPYGSKAVKTIKNFSNQISDFLVKQNVKMIVIACNTVSATCLEDLRKRHRNIPVIGIIKPTAEVVSKMYSSEDSVGVIGTKVTIASHSYSNYIKEMKEDINIHELACPIFAPLIEEGIVDDEIMDLTIKHYMNDFVAVNNLDALVLGCTHYPLIKRSIEKIYPDLSIINPSEIIVSKIEKELKKYDSFAIDNEEEKRDNVFYASDLSDNFLAMIDSIFKDSRKKVAFKNLDI